MSTPRNGEGRRPGDGHGRSELADPLEARARRAAASVRQRAPGAPGDGLDTVVARASRPRTPAVLAIVLLAVAVPVAVWSAAARTDRVEFTTPPPVETPTGTRTPDPLPTPTPGDAATPGGAATPGATPDETPAPPPAPARTAPAPDPRPEPEDGDTSTDPAAPDAAPADSPAPAPEPEPTGPAGTVPPVGEFGTEPVVAGDFPFGGGPVAYLTDVRVAAQDGFDRIVLELDGAQMPSYRVAYADPPILADGSGEELSVEGAAFLEIVLTPASGVRSDESGQAVTPTYTGPQRVRGGTVVVTEAVRTGDFEATLGWVAGLRSRAPFAVRVLSAPLRLVVDVQHP